MKVHVERVRQIEAALASVAAPAGSASLKVAVVSRVPGHRSVFSGRETLGRQTLAEALERVCVRPFSPDDIIFLMDGKNLDWYGDGPDDALLIACTAHPRSRDTLYLAASWMDCRS
jgi:hypothetical protein